MVYFRFANMLEMTDMPHAEVWTYLINMQSKVNPNETKDCPGGFSSELLDIEELTRKLNVEAKTGILSISRETLETAAQMYIYVRLCQHSIKPWALFYMDLLQNNSTDEIMLTLNRILKADFKNDQNKALLEIASDILKQITSLLQLKYGEIQDLSRGRTNSSLTNGKNDGKKVFCNILNIISFFILSSQI